MLLGNNRGYRNYGKFGRRARRGGGKILSFFMLLALLGVIVGSAVYSQQILDILLKTKNDITAKYSEKPASGEITAKGETADNFADFREKAVSLTADMTLDEKIYQMFFITPESLTGVETVIQAGEATKNALKNYPVGGIIYFSQNIKSSNQLSEMIKNTRSYSKIPLFIGVDEEGGRVARISGSPELGLEIIQNMSDIGKSGDSQNAYSIGERIAKNIKKFGFNAAFAPVADVLINPQNTEIGDRSFGSDPNIVSEMVKKEVRGLQENGVCSVLKHFPGHGSASANSHNGYSESSRTSEEFNAVDFAPFKEGIKAGADFVLVSHISALKLDSSGKPASLSKAVITDILRNSLAFEKLIITDSMSMRAITEKYSSAEAAVTAIEAGADIILMPESLSKAFNGVKEAVKSGRITEERINESVNRIFSVKLSRGII